MPDALCKSSKSYEREEEVEFPMFGRCQYIPPMSKRRNVQCISGGVHTRSNCLMQFGAPIRSASSPPVVRNRKITNSPTIHWYRGELWFCVHGEL